MWSVVEDRLPLRTSEEAKLAVSNTPIRSFCFKSVCGHKLFDRFDRSRCASLVGPFFEILDEHANRVVQIPLCLG